MSNRRKRVDEGRAVCNSEQDEWRDQLPESSQIATRIKEEVDQTIDFLKRSTETQFWDVEKKVVSLVFTLGRLFLAFHLAWCHQHFDARKMKRPGLHIKRAQPRLLGTYFGKVRYWRTYLRRKGGSGLYPLDAALGLTADGFSFNVMALGARLATMVPYDQVAGLLLQFHTWAPSKMSIENAVLGLGRYTAEWFEEAPPPDDDGEVLVIQIDGKATPTATDSELEKRRRKRGTQPRAPSPRHRGREKRRRRGSKPRRKKGDHSKNGRAAHLVVMYTLREGKDEKGKKILLGPINRKFHGSYASKRRAFEFARREANKRGFAPGCGKRIQIVTDGDEDLAMLSREFFPEAIHTLDVMHVMERIWDAGECLFKEGSPELKAWVKKMEALIYRGKALTVVGELASELERIPKTGPGNKGRRKRLACVRDYLFNRIDQMNYGWLRRQDLELASGNGEGAVKNVIGKRFDNGGMRWIRERAEALLQLRCIELNGDWEAFLRFVHERIAQATRRKLTNMRLLTRQPAPIPEIALCA
jgi:hypothetical protein